MATDPPPDPPADPLVGELHRESRDRRVLAVAAAIGIVVGAVLGVAFLGGVDPAERSILWHRAILLVLGAPAVSLAIGYAIYAVRRRRR